MNLLNPVLSFLFPFGCDNCDRLVEDHRDLPSCSKCWNDTGLYDGTETLCHKCGKLHSRKTTGIRTFCRECDSDFYDLARACGPYQDALKVTVLALKQTPFLANRTADLLFECYSREPFRDIDLIIPVPLSKRRIFERGFNQAEVIASEFSKRSCLPIDCHSLMRQKHSKVSRAAMDRKGRALSVFNAFEVKRHNLIRGKNLLLVDDVLTSGATVSMAAKALKKASARRVEVLCIARAGIT